MNRTVIISATAVVVFGLAGFADAASPAKSFLSISITPDILDLGTVPFAGLYDSPASLTVRVESNCAHGPIMVSATELTRYHGGSVSPNRLSVKSEATNGYVTMEKPVAVSHPHNGSHEIGLNFRVQGEMDPAGQYRGTLTFTIMPPPLVK